MITTILIILAILYYLLCVGFLNETLVNNPAKWFWIILFGYALAPVVLGMAIGHWVKNKL